MLTLWGEGRGFRVAWMLEEMGLPWRLRPVDMLAGVEKDPEFLAINPAGFIPALQDDETLVLESVAILQYLGGRYGPTPLAPEPGDPAYAPYLQFLHLGEAGLAGPVFFQVVTRILAPADAQDNWTARKAMQTFEGRRRLVARRLAEAPYMAGEAFTAADISVSFALEFAEGPGGVTLTDAELAYLERTTARPAYQSALDRCPAMKGAARRAR